MIVTKDGTVGEVFMKTIKQRIKERIEELECKLYCLVGEYDILLENTDNYKALDRIGQEITTVASELNTLKTLIN